MKTYRINKNAARLAQGTGFAPELIYNISLVRFQGRNGRCIAAWTPGIKRPRYVYKVHTPEEYDKAMERIRQEAERFRQAAERLQDACYTTQRLHVNGADALAAGIPPGPAVGRALRALLERVMDGALPNERGPLLAALDELALPPAKDAPHG